MMFFVALVAVAVEPASPQPAGDTLFAEWTAQAVHPSDAPDQGQAVVDDIGNVYLAGTFRGQASFGAITLTSNSNSTDLYVAKFDASGAALWAQSFGGPDPEEGRSIALDAAGNAYLTGRVLHVPTNFVKSDMFVVKFDAAGSLQWTSSIDATGHNEGTFIAADAAGNSYVAGSFNGTFTAGGTSYTAASRRMLIAKFDPQGSLIWARPANNGGFSDVIHGLAVDADQGVYVTGSFDGTVSFGDPVAATITSTDIDMFLLSYDPAGNLDWATSAGSGAGSDHGRSVAVDAQGNAHVAGTFSGTATFGPHTVSSTGGSDVFVARYDTNGAPLWVAIGGGTSNDFVESVAVASDGASLATGTFQGNADFGTTGLTAAGVNDTEIFVAGYDPSGAPSLAQSIGGPNHDAVYSIALDSAGSAYLAGYFAQQMIIDDVALTAPDFFDVFVAKLSPSSATCRGFAATIDMRMGASGIGTAGDDVIVGTSGQDVIDGLGGDDTICSRSGDDEVLGGDGNDVIFGGDGNDLINGGSGNDRLRGQSGTDLLFGSDGNDYLYGGIGDDQIIGGLGNDTIGGFGGADDIDAGAGDDVVFGGFGADVIQGGQGDDHVRGLEGNDVVQGGAGADVIYGDRGDDQLDGNAGDDALFGGNGPDVIHGGAGNDTLKGGKASDQIEGGAGTDTCAGNLGLDTATNCETTLGIP